METDRKGRLGEFRFFRPRQKDGVRLPEAGNPAAAEKIT
jgi:hypothetical protein